MQVFKEKYDIVFQFVAEYFSADRTGGKQYAFDFPWEEHVDNVAKAGSILKSVVYDGYRRRSERAFEDWYGLLGDAVDLFAAEYLEYKYVDEESLRNMFRVAHDAYAWDVCTCRDRHDENNWQCPLSAAEPRLKLLKDSVLPRKKTTK